jgi:hypothetical protein
MCESFAKSLGMLVRSRIGQLLTLPEKLLISGLPLH